MDPRAARTRRVLDALHEDPGLTYGELADRTGMPVKLLFAVLHRLQDEGHACHEADRWYPVLADG